MDSQWVMVVITAVLVCITAWYATETRRMAKKMAEQTAALLAPRVVVWAERRDGNVYLVVENQGASSAMELRLSSDREIPTDDQGFHLPLREHRLFQQHPCQLVPRARQEILVGSEAWVMEYPNYYKPELVITATFTWRGGEPVAETTLIEIGDLWSRPQWFNATSNRDGRT